MPDTEQASGNTEVEETIGRVEQLYQTLTGSPLPRSEAPYAPIPAERDPAEHVEKQLNRLLTILGELGGEVRPVPLTSWTPAMSVWESHTEIRDVPKNDDFRLHSSEAPIGPFRRTVFIPGGMREGEPRAEMKDGVLEIRIQKESSQVTTPRTVRVN